MSATIRTKNPSLRIILTSIRALDIALALAGGLALALAFPKTNVVWLAPLGAAALFWLWRTASWKRAFVLGWLGGFMFFLISCSWFGHTVGADLGPFAPVIVIVPAALEALAVGAAGAATAIAAERAPAWSLPLACAAAFTVFEWARSVGFFGTPFWQLGYTQATTPLAPIAAFAGTYGITFVLVALGAYLADAIARRSVRTLAIAYGVTAAVVVVAWFAWPARGAAIPTMRVAAIQGNIPQSLKWTAAALATGIERYTAQTRTAAAFRPQLIVWPETVVAEVLNFDPSTIARFERLASDVHATLVVGAQRVQDRKVYNSLFIFQPNGSPDVVYDKRQLVPFAEAFPAKAALEWLPHVSQLGGEFSSGRADTVFTSTPLSFAPLICWESAFADLAHAQVRNGAQVLVIATDDAWFGETAGPYMHAQIAQLRAIENGTWVVRAAATGVSGIIAPDGHYVASTQLDTRAIVTGLVGAPPGSFFARIGPAPVVLVFAALYFVLVFGLGKPRA
jgi:apolipoprotein N-acyltransferase